MLVRPSHAALAALAFVLAACASTPERAAAPRALQPAEHCPSASLRDGTGQMSASLGTGRIVASITDVMAQCSRDSEALVMRVIVRGSVIAEGGASGEAALPIRAAVIGGDRVLHSRLGRQAVTVAGTQTSFTYVDEGIRLPADAAGRVQVFAGFDEMS